MSNCKFNLTHPTNDEVVTADFDLQSNPGELVQQLIAQNWLSEPKDGSYAVVLTKENRTLADKDSFDSQEVADGSELSFRVRAVGAALGRRGPAADRLELDYLSLMDVRGRGCIGDVVAYADRSLTKRIAGPHDAHRMRRYSAVLNMRVLLGRGQFAPGCQVLVDLEASWSKYPSADYRPHVTFIGSRPWHYRIGSAGVLCTLPVGSRSYVCGQHLGSIAGLLNADEPFELPHDHGYQPDVYRYYQQAFGGPVDPGLQIPAVRESVFVDEQSAPLLKLTSAGRSPATLNIRRATA